jgi:hypothetical protein
MSEPVTVMAFSVPFPLLPWLTPDDAFKAEGDCPIGESRAHVVIDILNVQTHPPKEYLDSMGLSFETSGNGKQHFGIDRHGLFSFSKVTIAISGGHREADLPGFAVGWLNEIVRSESAKRRLFTVPLLTRRDILAYDRKPLGGGMFCGNPELEQLIAKHFAGNAAYTWYYEGCIGSLWGSEAHEGYAELWLERPIHAIAHISLAFELFANSAIWEKLQLVDGGTLEKKCTETLKDVLGGSLASKAAHGEQAIAYCHVRDLRNAVLHQGTLKYEVSFPDSNPKTSCRLRSEEDVVSHFDRVAGLIAYMADRLQLPSFRDFQNQPT